MTRIPQTVRDALVRCNDLERELATARTALRATLAPYVGQVFDVEGVPVKVCAGPSGPYLRRIVGPEKAAELREKWRSE